MLPDTITELDLFAPLPDPEDLFREPHSRTPGQDPTLLDFGTSQLLPDSQTPSRAHVRRTLQLDDDDLGLDLGLEPMSVDRSVEVGRRAQTPRNDDPTLLNDNDLGLDLGMDDDDTIGPRSSLRPTGKDGDVAMLGADDDLQMGDGNEDIATSNAAALARADAATDRRQRRSDSLSSIHSSMERDLEKTFQLDPDAEDADEASMVKAAQRIKRRKVMRMDNETELRNSQIKKQQEDRSAIVKAPSFLPRDPWLLQLMEMQRNGNFVSSLMGDGRMQGWAPELRGIMSLEVVRKAGDKKRKRDSGIADVGIDGERQDTPQLELPLEEDEGFGQAGDFGPEVTLNSDGAVPLIMSDGMQPEENFGAFDITEAPLLHPSQSGAVALGTKKMVHLLREHFAPEHPKSANEPPTPSKRVKSSAHFTDLCPEANTSRPDATKMFFELLVLGTKDAIKVEQDSGDLGLPIRVRGKRGLWGDWAEMNPGGEIATQEREAEQRIADADA